MIYQLYNNLLNQSGAYYVDEHGRMISFLFDPDNKDYQAFLLWKSEGNEPLPADE